ncbi:hypothetical protein A3863_05700 (plasmid) [Priestia endophytica]|uniref:Uncharacterized protein n=1 Tax=Priestia endophytica TaxID=135735 RepID=A0AAX1QGK0_9BACI|nr:hypothetical protein A3864_04040 [Priestia endophytica]RAS91521.1 hypothetical protein A3863_05700 [Priestia endophytica]
MNKLCLFLPTGEGAPSKFEGVGGVLKGSNGLPLVVVWGRHPKVFFMREHEYGYAVQASQSTHFWNKSIVCYTLHGSVPNKGRSLSIILGMSKTFFEH